MVPTGPSSFPFWRLAACLLVVIAACCPILYLNRQIAKSTNICIGLRDDSQLPAPCLELRFFGQTRVHNIWLWRYYVRSVFGFAAVFLVSFILYPVAQRLAATLRERWRAFHTALALAACAVGLSDFILYFGSRQFGAWDYGILIDAGWRLLQGQRLYQDFVSPMPSGFFLGVKLAFAWFGVRWISTLLMTAIFASGCFVWMYFLFAALLGRRLNAFLAALAIECVTMLLFCYWWYNNTASLAAVVFLLSCLLYLKNGGRPGAQFSYAASLTLLGFMKANTAGPMILAGVVLVFLGTRGSGKIRVLLLTLGAATANVAILLMNNVSLTGLFASYLMSARERGGAFYGMLSLGTVDRGRAFIGLVLCGSLVAWWPQFRRAVERRDRPAAAGLLLLPAAILTGFLAMLSNLDMKDADLPLIIASGVLLLNHFPARWHFPVRLYVCLLCAVAVTDVYAGTVRYRVSLIGPHLFFEWEKPMVNPGVRFFQGVQASPVLKSVVKQTAEVLKDAQRPVFFGPRMEFAYAAFGEPSPKDLGLFWGPPTSFPCSEEPRMEEVWRKKRFRTVILLNQDMTYYSVRFQKLIFATYEADYVGSITVLRLREPGIVRRLVYHGEVALSPPFAASSCKE